MNTEYTITRSTTDSQIPLIANIPHSSTFIPQKIRESFVLTDAELSDELLRMTDYYTDELFSAVTDIGGVSFSSKCYADITGTSATAYVWYA